MGLARVRDRRYVRAHKRNACGSRMHAFRYCCKGEGKKNWRTGGDSSVRVRPCVCVCAHASVFPRSEARSSIFNAAETTSTQPEPGEASFFAQANLACQQETKLRGALWKASERGCREASTTLGLELQPSHSVRETPVKSRSGRQAESRCFTLENKYSASPLNK